MFSTLAKIALEKFTRVHTKDGTTPANFTGNTRNTRITRAMRAVRTEELQNKISGHASVSGHHHAKMPQNPRQM